MRQAPSLSEHRKFVLGVKGSNVYVCMYVWREREREREENRREENNEEEME